MNPQHFPSICDGNTLSAQVIPLSLITIQLIKNNLSSEMPIPESPTCHTHGNPLKLPKIALTKIFRIRSASKEKPEHAHCQKNGQKDAMRQDSHQKYRSNSLKISNKSLSNKKSVKSLKKKVEESSNMEDDSVDVGSCKFNSKYSNHNNVEAMQKQHERNMQKLSHIAKLFDPSTIMKMGGQQQNHPKQNRKQMKVKEQIRLNHFIFEGKHSGRHRPMANPKSNQNYEIEEYWRKVNESLILAPCKTVENQVSKDLREMYETLVTE